ncbi:MAG: DUF58 domain-containing protein [Bacteroidetes bacterium]|jgi:uncharacterized protein (DUF58 family)|nr:DUF58 domain-containing protein [Bacteroidota bacterium]
MNIFDRYNIRALNNLDLLAQQVVEGFIIGLHKSPFHGFSVEFAEHRLYNQGESTRNIDWKVYARTDKLFTKRYEEETNLRCQIIIDQSSSMHFPQEEDLSEGQINKFQFSCLAAASLMNLLKKQRDAFGLSLFDDQINIHSPTKSSTSHYRLMLTYLERALSGPHRRKSTAAAEALHHVAERVHKRSLVIVFSDMLDRMDNADELFAGLQHLKHSKHEVILFHTVHEEKEIDLGYANRPYIFEDVETGEKVKVRPKEVRQQYKESLKKFRRELRLKCLQYKIQFVETDIQKGFEPILQSVLIQRKKMKVT